MGQHERGRGPASRPKLGADSTAMGVDPPGARRRSWAAPPAGGSAGPRVTNLIPQARLADERPTASRPRNVTNVTNVTPRAIKPPRLKPDTGGTSYIPRQTNGMLKAASAAPLAPNAPMKTTGAPAGPSSARMRELLARETFVLPALSDTDGGPGDSGGRIRRRRTSSARPVRDEDTALVERQTLIMRALEIVGEDARIATAEVPALRNPAAVVVVDGEPSERVPVIVVPAGDLAPTPSWLRPQWKGQRGLLAGIASCLVTLSLILGVLMAASPLSSAQGATPLFGLFAVRNASNSATGAPAGPWDTQASAGLGLGGGAGPGVHAPGSAGLPVGKSSGASGVKTNSAPKTSGVISPPPVRPWPPRWAYMYVPGHPAFKVNRPANGYYWWAFGQCTWWAQYKRQDENLRRMGNARYWAAGAMKRGYHVGRTPRAGATVVFQPGVEGAGGAGHVAHVERVYPGGWFLVSEMNFYWNGGGWGRVSYRFAYARSGVSFIY